MVIIFLHGHWPQTIGSCTNCREDELYSNLELRKKFRATSPLEALRQLASVQLSVTEEDEFRPPLITVWLASGQNFRGYLVNASTDKDHMFLFQQETETETDGAADLIYVYGSRIEAVTIWNVDDQPEDTFPGVR